MHRLTLSRLGACAVGLLLVSACGKGSEPVTPRVPASVAFALSADSLLVGDSKTYSATVRDDRGSLLVGVAVSWSSLTPAVATVAGGVVRAESPGDAQIVAAAGTVSDTLMLRVVPRPLRSVTLTPRYGAAGFALQGDTLTLLAVAADDRGTRSPRAALTLSTTGGTLLSSTLTDSGTVATVAIDTLTTTLRVRTDFLAGGVPSADSATIAVFEPVRIFGVYPTTIEARPGATQPLRVDIYGRSLTVPLPRVRTYAVADPSIATVAIDGTITMHRVGSTVVTVSAGGRSQSVPLTVRAAGDTPFPIDIRVVGPQPDPATMAQIEEGVRTRWQRVLSAPAAPQQVTLQPGNCGTGTPAVNEVTTGVIIFFRIDSIDGPGKTLGYAGPCGYRAGDFTAAVGVITFDSADVRGMVAGGYFDDVAGHEAGHVLGIGTLWRISRYVNGVLQLIRALSPVAGLEDPRYEGGEGNRAALEAGWVNARDPRVPIENTGGGGTRDSHWRESVFTTELMTGWASPNAPLSAFTARSLRDLGYTVDPAGADPALPQWAGPLSAPTSAAQAARVVAPAGVQIEGAETVLVPRFRFDRTGRPVPLGPMATP